MNCAHCRKPVARKPRGMRLFCGRKCFGLDRRKHKSKAQKVAEKRLYDAAYRTKNRAMLKAKKSAYFQRTYDPRKAAIVRKKRMPYHVAYCRQPRYVAWKRDYDKVYRAKDDFGPFWESAILVAQLGEEVQSRMSKYDIRIVNGHYNKAQFRRRAYESQHQAIAVRR